MSIAIEFNNVSKQYRLGLVSTKTLSHDLDRWWKVNVMHKEDPYLKIGSVNDRSQAADSEYVWALKDIDFKVEQGDVVGIIGKNGAGKSTLLKLLSKVTGPTTGTIRARGRIGSLLEVGTGFHQEMTGRENIFLNGAILGMTKQEIARKLDEIVDFSGCERYIDTPVKRYSSGMMVRLGFAVAAHLDPEILVVDEVLAVGDAEFQKKAIGKMQDVSKGEGRTVLFVSHNMTSIKNLCKTGVLIENGMVKYTGNINDTIDHYLSNKNMTHYDNLMDRFEGKSKPQAYFTDVYFMDEKRNVVETLQSGEKGYIVAGYHTDEMQILNVNIGVYNSIDEKLLHLSTEYVGVNETKNCTDGKIVFSFDRFPLPEGCYKLNMTLWGGYQRLDWLKDCISLNVCSGDFYNSGRIPPASENKVLVDYSWNLEK